MGQELSLGAVDIGNSGLRVMQGILADGRISLSEVLRVPNAPFQRADGWHWDVERLAEHMRAGLRTADLASRLDGIAVDTWGVDYGLVNEASQLIDAPFSYRDERSLPMIEVARERISAERLYALTGCQDMAINSLYQLLDDQRAGRLEQANRFLMMCDLFQRWLTDVDSADETNASTTGLFDPQARDWCWDAIDAVGLPRRLFAPVRTSGTVLGETTADSGIRAGIPVVTAAGHDTAAAFVAGADVPGALVISIGTWSLVGVERGEPLITEAGRTANCTNEVGVLGTIRFLRNAAGMWVLQECMREWRAGEPDLGWDTVLGEAERAPALTAVFDPDDRAFMAPGAMVARVVGAGRGSAAGGRGCVVRSILESLALNHRWLLETVQRVTGEAIERIRIVGGGAQNRLLCQMTADATGIPVIAGPIEATALGNIAMQAIALGAIPGLADARSILANSFRHETYEPAPESAWDAAYQRWLGLISR